MSKFSQLVLLSAISSSPAATHHVQPVLLYGNSIVQGLGSDLCSLVFWCGPSGPVDRAGRNIEPYAHARGAWSICIYLPVYVVSSSRRSAWAPVNKKCSVGSVVRI